MMAEEEIKLQGRFGESTRTIMMDPSDDPADDLVREMYARFGLAYYYSEVLHRGLCNIYAMIDFPIWMLHFLDKEAERLGIPRQSLIKVWVAERLEKTLT
jgi:hypothetical protein